VLASKDTFFQDVAHFPRGEVPGDGQHVIWKRPPLTLRSTRGRNDPIDRPWNERPWSG